MEKILVIEDDPAMQALLEQYLSEEGYEVLQSSTLQQARHILKQNEIALVLLDLRLKESDGLDLLRERQGNLAPYAVIILSGKTEVMDRIVGLEMGADDFLTKPVNLRELLARIHSVLRRRKYSGMQIHSAQAEGKVITFANWRMDLDRQSLVNMSGDMCRLTSGEFKLLKAFTSCPQRVLSRDQLLDMVSGQKRAPFDRTIDTQVRRLRQKLEPSPCEPCLIKTIRGCGYMFSEKVEVLH